MRIAVNARFLIKDKLEGVGWYTYEILRRMVANHPEVEFILIHDRPLAKEYIFAKNVKSVKTLTPSRHPILWYFWFEHSIPRVLKKCKVDVFLSFDGHLSIKTDIPTVYVLHDLAYLHYPNEIPSTVLKFYQKFIPQYIDKAKHIVSVSNHGKQDILKHFPHIKEDSISIVGNATRDIFKPISAIERKNIQTQYANGQKYFFYVGAVQPRKNISRMIQAFDLFSEAHPECQLLIAGRSAWKMEQIKKTYEESKHRDKIQFLGYVEDQNMAKIMAAAECFIYPSLFEGFGVPILEAMQCAVPIITSKDSAMSEVAGNAALLVDPENVNDISVAMIKVFDNKSLSKELVQNGNAQKEKYNWNTSAIKMYEAIQKTTSSA